MPRTVAHILRLTTATLILSAFLATPWVALQSVATPAAVHAATKRPQQPVVRQQSAVANSQPVRILIPRLDLDLSVVPGDYDYSADAWTLTDTDVQFATMTALPGTTPGNTLLYGHNTVQVLEPTKNLHVGDELIVTLAGGQTYHYRYRADELVKPTNTRIFDAASTTPQVTLLTCNGSSDEWRRLMYFDLAT